MADHFPTDTATMSDPNRTLGDLVTERPGAARVLERYGLDYCCGGGATLAEACTEHGVDLAAVTADLDRVEHAPAPDWASMTASELAEHIVETHHAYLREELPRLSSLAEKVAGVHGTLHPELYEVRRTFELLKDDLLPHLVKEERVLFPAVAELERADQMPWFPFGSARGPISIMLTEHDTVGELLEQLRRLTDGYTVPEGGCGSYRSLYSGLEAVERDTHLHVHKENNVLFPAVVRMESRLSQVATSPG